MWACAGSGRVHTVLAADLTKFGLDADTVGAGAGRDLGGDATIVLIRQVGSVVHHRVEAEVDGLGDQCGILGMVEMDGDAGRGRTRDGQRGRGDRGQAAMEAHAILTDLEDYVGAGCFGCGDDGLGGFE